MVEGNDLVWLAFHQALQHLALPVGQRHQPVVQHRAFHFFLIDTILAIERRLNRMQKRLVVVGFLEEIGGAEFHRLDCQRDVTMACDDDDGDVDAAVSQ